MSLKSQNKLDNDQLTVIIRYEGTYWDNFEYYNPVFRTDHQHSHFLHIEVQVMYTSVSWIDFRHHTLENSYSSRSMQ